MNNEALLNLPTGLIPKLTPEHLVELGFTAHEIIELMAMAPNDRCNRIAGLQHQAWNKRLNSFFDTCKQMADAKRFERKPHHNLMLEAISKAEGPLAPPTPMVVLRRARRDTR